MLLLGLVVIGCATAKPDLRTPMPEQFAGPPEDDPRYSQPIEYPKELLNKPPVKPTSPGDKFKGGGAPGNLGMP
jgi:hypothetical protein